MQNLRSKIIAILHQPDSSYSAEMEAELILLHFFRRQDRRIQDLSTLKLSAPEATPEIEKDAIEIAQTRASGIPLQHLLGNQYFFEHEYQVNDSTLIPRPETEILVQETLTWIENNIDKTHFKFAELGLGSGIISTEILNRFGDAIGYASETNPLAIALARQNLETILGLDFQTHLHIIEPHSEISGFEVFLKEAPFDLIVSNPPYLSTQDEVSSEVIQHEPHEALFPKKTNQEENPNYFYKNFLEHVKQLLSPEGSAFFEVPHERAVDLLNAFQEAGLVQSKLISDLTGRHRVLQARF